MRHVGMLLLVSLVPMAAGCQSLPSGAGSLGEPPGEAVIRGNNEDPYDGWLYNWASGQGTPEERAAQMKQAAEQQAAEQQAAATATSSSGPVLAQPANAAGSAGAAVSSEQASDEPRSVASLPAGAKPVDISHLPQLPPSDRPLEQYGEEDEEDDGPLADINPEKWWKNLKEATGFGPDETLARQYYTDGMKFFEQRKFEEAAQCFEKAGDRWPDSPLEEDALFMTGESYFFADRYDKSHDAFLMLFKKYEFSTHLETAVAREFAIGLFWMKHHEATHEWPTTPNLTDKTRPLFDTFGNAINAFLSVRLNDPTGPLADDAVMASANAYFLLGRWEEAAYHYELLRTEYPNSEFQQTAHVLGLQAKMRVYQGANYDGAALVESRELADRTLKQYRQDLGEELPRVAKARDQIETQMAERVWAMGQYYDRNHYYGAARIYYHGVIQDYPDTPLAPLARKRLDEIRNEPDTPPDRLGWLKRTLDPTYRQPGEKPKLGQSRR